MYVAPVEGQSQAVTPVTIGTLHIGAIDVSYEYTLTVRLVKDYIKKFFPKQQVSAFVSDSLTAIVPGAGSWTLGFPAFVFDNFLIPV